MGGIILRQIMNLSPFFNLDLVFMLGFHESRQRNYGKFGSFKLIPLINEPAFFQLERYWGGFIQNLGPFHFKLGAITGNRNINPFLSFLIPSLDDEKVSVERAKSEGMNDFIEVPNSHSFMMDN